MSLKFCKCIAEMSRVGRACWVEIDMEKKGQRLEFNS